jgi:hypothetical protein
MRIFKVFNTLIRHTKFDILAEIDKAHTYTHRKKSWKKTTLTDSPTDWDPPPFSRQLDYIGKCLPATQGEEWVRERKGRWTVDTQSVLADGGGASSYERGLFFQSSKVWLHLHFPFFRQSEIRSPQASTCCRLTLCLCLLTGRWGLEPNLSKRGPRAWLSKILQNFAPSPTPLSVY